MQKAAIHWIVDTSILEDGRNSTLPQVLRDLGHTVFEYAFYKGVPLPEIPFENTECVVIYGSHQFNRALASHKFSPGSLGLTDRTNCTAYLSNLPREWFLNNDFVMTTWRDFVRRRDFWFDLFESDRVFIRPNSGFKTFTGTIVPKDDWDHEILGLEKVTSVMDETLILVAKPKEILGEFRFVIADGKVVTGSEYRWDNVLDIRIDYPADCFELAKQVAEHDWQVDIAYTCDVALTPDGAKVVELNSFSCAGLYACDLTEVGKHVSKAAWREWSGDEGLDDLEER